MELALILLTAALVVTTAIYAYFTWKMVTEMRATRLLSIRPRLVLDVKMLDPIIAVVALKNVGPGPAINVEATLAFEPNGLARSWTARVFLAGDVAQFNPPSAVSLGARARSVRDFAVSGSVVRLLGRAYDLDGNEYELQDDFDVGAWWATVSNADQIFIREPAVELNREVRKARTALGRLADDVRRIAERPA